ncbi:MAG: 23S rRNA (guanosine(2251)-2'-O)-methyltransferase RlmB [Thiotrichales bacterium]
MSAISKIVGLHAVEAALRNDPKRVKRLYYKTSRQDKRLAELLSLARQAGVSLQGSDEKSLAKMSGGQRHQGIIADYQAVEPGGEGDLEQLLDTLEHPPFLLVLDGVTDPHNLGACLRSADAAGIDAVVMPRDNAVGLTPVVRKVASGAAETVPSFVVTNLSRTLAGLQQRGIWTVGTSDDAPQTLYEQDLTGPLALIMGAEGKGMRRLTREHCDYLVSIPMAGQVESLNISVAAGVCLFEAVRQRRT